MAAATRPRARRRGAKVMRTSPKRAHMEASRMAVVMRSVIGGGSSARKPVRTTSRMPTRLRAVAMMAPAASSVGVSHFSRGLCSRW